MKIRITLDSFDVEGKDGEYTVWMDEPTIIGEIEEGFFALESVSAKLFEHNTTRPEDTEEQFTHHKTLATLPRDVQGEVECGLEEYLSEGVPVDNVLDVSYI